MSDTNLKRKWTVPEAKTAVKTVFMLREYQEVEDLEMRHVDIRRAIEMLDRTRTLYPNMLSSALRELKEDGDLTCRKDGREIWYSFAVKRERREMVALHANTHATLIRNSSSFGAVSDFREGWSFYGIPDSIKRKLRPGLRSEAKRFMIRMHDLVEEEHEEYVRLLEKKLRGKMEMKQIKAGMKALRTLFDYQSSSGWDTHVQILAKGEMERIAPGSFHLLSEKLSREIPASSTGKITYLANWLSVPRDKVEEAVSELGEMGKTIRRLFDALPESDRKSMVDRLSAITTANANLIAVMR